MKLLRSSSQIPPQHQPQRRRFLFGAAAATALLANPAMAGHVVRSERKLGLHNLHTGERVNTVYWAEGEFVEEGLVRINQVLRDHRTDEVTRMDPRLIDLLFNLHRRSDGRRPFEIISGYRSPATNKMLRKKSSGVAKRSYHMKGQAIDLRLPGRELRHLRKAALALKGGGVGYYPKSGFIHVDTGPVRGW